nr:hypothetical protein Iba_chr11aCG10390 [Ipomoea batatas]
MHVDNLFSSSTFQNRSDDPNAEVACAAASTAVVLPRRETAVGETRETTRSLLRRRAKTGDLVDLCCVGSKSWLVLLRQAAGRDKRKVRGMEVENCYLSAVPSAAVRDKRKVRGREVDCRRLELERCEAVGVEGASMVLATLSMLDMPENVFLITLMGVPCFPMSAIASPNSPIVEASFCKIPATLSTLYCGILTVGSASTGASTFCPEVAAATSKGFAILVITVTFQTTQTCFLL